LGENRTRTIPSGNSAAHRRTAADVGENHQRHAKFRFGSSGAIRQRTEHQSACHGVLRRDAKTTKIRVAALLWPAPPAGIHGYPSTSGIAVTAYQRASSEAHILTFSVGTSDLPPLATPVCLSLIGCPGNCVRERLDRRGIRTRREPERSTDRGNDRGNERMAGQSARRQAIGARGARGYRLLAVNRAGVGVAVWASDGLDALQQRPPTPRTYASFRVRTRGYLLRCDRPLSRPLQSVACRRSLPTESPKAAIAHDAEVVFLQLSATRR
jgi:hypothetical protein